MDRLANVKAFYYGVALSALGSQQHIGIDDLEEDAKALYNRIVPALYHAILADDPAYDPVAVHLEGAADSSAASTGAVRWFVELLEANKAFMEITGESHGRLYTRLYQPGQYSCFLDDLRAALRRDDPDWRP